MEKLYLPPQSRCSETDLDYGFMGEIIHDRVLDFGFIFPNTEFMDEQYWLTYMKEHGADVTEQ